MRLDLDKVDKDEYFKYKAAIQNQVLTLTPGGRTVVGKINWGGSPSDHDKIIMIVNQMLESHAIMVMLEVKSETKVSEK